MKGTNSEPFHMYFFLFLQLIEKWNHLWQSTQKVGCRIMELTTTLQIIQCNLLNVLFDVPTSRIWKQYRTLEFQIGQKDENYAYENEGNVYGKFTEYVGLFLLTTRLFTKGNWK